MECIEPHQPDQADHHRLGHRYRRGYGFPGSREGTGLARRHLRRGLEGHRPGTGLRPGRRCTEPQTGRPRIEHQRCHHPVSHRYFFSGFLCRHDQFRLPPDAAARRIGCQQ